MIKKTTKSTCTSSYRTQCYRCYRPQSVCLCSSITQINTKTKFVILMHKKEFQKTKNGTGIFSHLSLKNSELFVGIDFSDNTKINAIVADTNNNCFVLYPSQYAMALNSTDIVQSEKNTVIFLIDSTWACASKILRESKNIKNLPHISFYHDKTSAFGFKKQPQEICLCTAESIHCVLEILKEKKHEDISQENLDKFLKPFHTMVALQMQYTKEKYES